MSPLSFIVVHGGAGVHGVKNEKEVKQALRTACIKALDESSSTSSLNMVENALKVLEEDVHLNAGYGSNLTIEGTVECDASIMHARGTSVSFGSVGALSGIKNPISAARAVLDHSRTRDKLGRVPPLMLVSSGAHSFACARGVQAVQPESLIAPSAHEQWTKWKARLDTRHEEEGGSAAHIAAESEGDDANIRNIQDTVGAVAFCHGDGMAAGVSSGGLLLKYPGRVGEAAVYGAGCWAGHVQSASGMSEGVACSVSGTGEHIVKAALARRIGDALGSGSSADENENEEKDPHGILERLLTEFWESCCREGEDKPSAGAIVLTTESPNGGDAAPRGRLWCAFTTASMAVAYASTRNPKPKAAIFRHPNPHAVDESSQSGGKPQIYITSLVL